MQIIQTCDVEGCDESAQVSIRRFVRGEPGWAIPAGWFLVEWREEILDPKREDESEVLGYLGLSTLTSKTVDVLVTRLCCPKHVGQMPKIREFDPETDLGAGEELRA